MSDPELLEVVNSETSLHCDFIIGSKSFFVEIYWVLTKDRWGDNSLIETIVGHAVARV